MIYLFPFNNNRIGFAVILVFFLTVALAQEDQKFNFKSVANFRFHQGDAYEKIYFDAKKSELFVLNDFDNTIELRTLDKNYHANKNNNQFITDFIGAKGVYSFCVNDRYIALSVESSFDSYRSEVDKGEILLIDRNTQKLVHKYIVGINPKQIKFTPDNRYLICINKGSFAYQECDFKAFSDITIIDLESHKSTVLYFKDFPRIDSLLDRIVRQDGIEPESFIISEDSSVVWVNIQLSNKIIVIDLKKKKFLRQFSYGTLPLVKVSNETLTKENYTKPVFNTYPVNTFFQPDGIALIDVAHKGCNKQYLITADEGDSVNSLGCRNLSIIKDLSLDKESFSNVEHLKNIKEIGEIEVFKNLGDTDKDGDYEQLYTSGTRSFSIWDLQQGDLVFNSRTLLSREVLKMGRYPKERVNYRGVEPELVEAFTFGSKNYIILSLERAGDLVIYDISDPIFPKLVKYINSGVFYSESIFVSKTITADDKEKVLIFITQSSLKTNQSQIRVYELS